MRNKILWMTAVVISLCSSQGLAQLKRFEVLAGPGMMSVRSDAPFFKEAFDPKISLGGGVGFVFAVNENLTFNTQLLYERKGLQGDVELRDNNNAVTASGKIYLRLNSISIPATIGYEFGDKVKMQVAGGLFVGTLVSQKFYSTVDDQSQDTDYKKIDFGVTGVFSLFVPINDKYDIKLGLQDNLGFANLSKSNVTVNTNALNLFIGSSFHF